MSLPTSFLMLETAALGMSVLDRFQTYSDQTSQVYAQYDLANRQVAINNGLNYNSKIHLNEVQMLKTKEFQINTAMLHRAIRRADAKEKVLIESQGGDSTIGSGAARIRNIQNQGSEALKRKDFNFQLTLADLNRRRKNIDLETMSANNRAFTGLQTPPSATGLVTDVAGLGIESFAKVGYYTGKDGQIHSRFDS